MRASVLAVALARMTDVEVPRSEAPGETDSFVLYDSKRDYLTQMDFYNAWRDGDDGEASHD